MCTTTRTSICLRGLSGLALFLALTGCASSGLNFGIALPIGRAAGVGVSVGTDGRIGTSVGVGVGGGAVSVGTSGQLPPLRREPAEPVPVPVPPAGP